MELSLRVKAAVFSFLIMTQNSADMATKNPFFRESCMHKRKEGEICSSIGEKSFYIHENYGFENWETLGKNLH